MFKIPKETIIERIVEQTELSKEEVTSKIQKKLKQLSGLISEEGAAHIVANELGVKVLEQRGRMKIKDIIPGMRNVDVAGKIIAKYEIRTFDKQGRKGKVGSFLLGDESGAIRAVAWNEKADILEKLKEEMIVKIKGGYARENRNGRKELHLGDNSEVILKPDDVESIETGNLRKKIKELRDNEENVEIMGTIVQVYDPRFFEVCPECGQRAREKEDGYYCNDHQKVEPNYSYVVNLFVDDGSDNIRVVLWRTQTARLLEKSHEEIVGMKDQPFEDVKHELLGKIVKLVGRTTKNEMFDRLEFIPQLVYPNPDPEKELERLHKELQTKSEEKKHAEKDTNIADSPSLTDAAADVQVAEPKKTIGENLEIEDLSLDDLEELT